MTHGIQTQGPQPKTSLTRDELSDQQLDNVDGGLLVVIAIIAILIGVKAPQSQLPSF